MKILDRKRNYFDGTKYIYCSSPRNFLLYGFIVTGHIICGKNHYVHRENFDAYSLIYCKSGTCNLSINNKQYVIKPGNLAFYNLSDTTILHVTDDEPFVAEFIYIYGPNMNFFYDENNIIIENFDNTYFSRKILEIYTQTINNKIDYYNLSSDIYSILMNVLKNKIYNNDYSNIYKAITFIHNNYSKDIKLKDIADEAFTSKCYFVEKFYSFTKYTPIQYLNKIRLEQAKIFLKDTSLTIDQVAVLVGFQNTRNLNNAFKKEFKMNTTTYRKLLIDEQEEQK